MLLLSLLLLESHNSAMCISRPQQRKRVYATGVCTWA